MNFFQMCEFNFFQMLGYVNLMTRQWCPKQIGASSMMGFVVVSDQK